MSNQQVADKPFITVGTTKWHLYQIFGRLPARNRTEAVARARELNLSSVVGKSVTASGSRTSRLRSAGRCRTPWSCRGFRR
ncbi:helix-turn-helix transcriptional regulator [Amycolatopsis sp. NPDC049252]|uniref:helix-turn-helix transcriptional regulator n=1 Tax=Amycolatopsis sp. NPDC049252 TaxID=3363933 RepID=UPI003722F061